MTNPGSANLLLVIDRLFIQMNADYRGGFSMRGQLARAMNKLLPAAQAPLLSVVPLQAFNDIGQVHSTSRSINSKRREVSCIFNCQL